MKRTTQVILFALLVIGCKSHKQGYKNYASESLKIEQISKNLYNHISYLDTTSFGKYPCNGMIYINGNEAIKHRPN